MIENLIQTLAQSRLVEGCVSAINRLSLPYTRLPVTVRGQRMYAHTLDRYLALWLWKVGLLAASEVRLLARLCGSGAAVVDIGANVGFYTLLFARWVGREGRVWAFEPDPDNFATLQRNLRANGCTGIVAVNRAVCAASGEGSLYRSGAHSGDHRVYCPADRRDAVPIQTVALDDFFPPGQRVDLVKMDVQGAEGLVLAGMNRVIQDNPQLTMFIEFWPLGLRQAGSEPEALLVNLQARGFALERLDNAGGLQSVDSPRTFVESLPGDQYTHLLIRRT